MKQLNLGLLLLLALPFGASAQGFYESDTCYTWQGGNFSAGSFTKCNPPWIIVKAEPKVVATPVAQPVIQPSPVMMPITCAPEPKPVIRKKKPAKKC